MSSSYILQMSPKIGKSGNTEISSFSPTSPTCPYTSTRQVKKQMERQNGKNAAGPDGVSHSFLISVWDSTSTFNVNLSQGKFLVMHKISCLTLCYLNSLIHLPSTATD